MQLAQSYIQQKKYKAALEIVQRWQQKKKRFHISEFRVFCATQLELHLAQKDFDDALKVLRLWEQFEPESSFIKDYKEDIETMQTLYNLLNKHRKRKKA